MHNALAAMVLLALFVLMACAPGLFAQTIQIKLVNGKTGHPITDRSLLNLWVGKARLFPMMVPTDKHGIITLRLTQNDAEINVPECPGEGEDFQRLSQTKAGKDERKLFDKKYSGCSSFEVDLPVVHYADSIRLMTLPGDVSWKAGGQQVPYIPCWLDPKVAGSAWRGNWEFSADEILKSGVVTANSCGNSMMQPTPGVLVLFVRAPSTKESWQQIWDY